MEKLNYLKKIENFENNNREVSINIIDKHNDIVDKTILVDFNTINELDKKINKLNIMKVIVVFDDFNNVLTDDEKEYLENLGYYFM